MNCFIVSSPDSMTLLEVVELVDFLDIVGLDDSTSKHVKKNLSKSDQVF